MSNLLPGCPLFNNDEGRIVESTSRSIRKKATLKEAKDELEKVLNELYLDKEGCTQQVEFDLSVQVERTNNIKSDNKVNQAVYFSVRATLP